MGTEVVGVTFRVPPGTRDELTKEALERGFTTTSGKDVKGCLNKYLPVVVAARHNTGAGDTAEIQKLKDQLKTLTDNAAISSKLIESLKGENAQLKGDPKKPVQDNTKLVDHICIRAWEISRIPREKLLQGFS